MGVCSDFKDLVKIVRDGGLEVVTETGTMGPQGNTSTTTVRDKQETREKRKTYKIYDRIGIRTTIQLDADYVTMMSPEVLGMPELCKRHAEILKEKLSVLERVRGLAWKTWAVIFLPSMALTLYTQFVQISGYPGVRLDLWPVLSLIGVVGAVISFIMLFLNRIMWWLAKSYVRRRFSPLVSIWVKG